MSLSPTPDHFAGRGTSPSRAPIVLVGFEPTVDQVRILHADNVKVDSDIRDDRHVPRDTELVLVSRSRLDLFIRLQLGFMLKHAEVRICDDLNAAILEINILRGRCKPKDLDNRLARIKAVSTKPGSLSAAIQFHLRLDYLQKTPMEMANELLPFLLAAQFRTSVSAVYGALRLLLRKAGLWREST